MQRDTTQHDAIQRHKNRVYKVKKIHEFSLRNQYATLPTQIDDR